MKEAGKIFWLASYPKSGNTWMRAQLSNYFGSSGKPADINALLGGLGASRSRFEEHMGIESGDLSPGEVQAMLPGFYQSLAGEAEEQFFLKLHDAYRDLFAGQGAAGALYLVRNPLDVAVSFAHHSVASLPVTVGWMADEQMYLTKEHRFSHQLSQFMGSWSGHVRGWLDQRDLPVERVRYEDMLADPVSVLERVVRFLGFSPDLARVRQAVGWASFDKLQSQEETDGFHEKYVGTQQFFRQGKAGTWRQELSPELAARVIADHGEVMTRLGYLDASGQPTY